MLSHLPVASSEAPERMGMRMRRVRMKEEREKEREEESGRGPYDISPSKTHLKEEQVSHNGSRTTSSGNHISELTPVS